MKHLEEQLGKKMTVQEVASFLGIDEKTVRKYYADLGGVRLGRAYLFFEKEVINAIQARKTLDGSGTSQRQEATQDISDQGRRPGLGGRRERKHGTINDIGADPHDLFS